MFVDGESRFSAAQSVTTGSGSGSAPGVRSTNILNLGVERYIGTGKALYVVVQVTTALASSGSNDAMEVNLFSDTDEAFGSPTFVQQICVLPAVSVAGTGRYAQIAPNRPIEKYIGLYYVSQTSDAFSAAGITAFVTTNIQAYKSFDDNVTVS